MQYLVRPDPGSAASMPVWRLIPGKNRRTKKAREIWYLCGNIQQGGAGNGPGEQVVPLPELEDERSAGVKRSCSIVHWPEDIKTGLNAELDGQAGIQEFAGNATMLYYMTEEAQEGKKAFLEKRKPDFKKYPKLP